LRERRQNWREDSSNQNVVFLRNRLRHRLLPMISAEFGEAAIEHMGDLAEIARAEEEHWELGHAEICAQTRVAGPHASIDEAMQPASLPVGPLLALPLAAQRRFVRTWLETNASNLNISFRLIGEVLGLAGEPAGKKTELSSGWNLLRERQALRLESEPR